MEKKVLDDWLLMNYVAQPVPIEVRVRLLPELLRLAGEVKDGHLNSTRIEIDDRQMKLSLNEDRGIQDEYASPELLQDKMKNSFTSAVFSLGILVDELKRGSTYIMAQNWNRIEIEDNINKFGNDWLKPLSDDPLSDIIRGCTRIDSIDRPQTPSDLRQMFLENSIVQQYWPDIADNKSEIDNDSNGSNQEGPAQDDSRRETQNVVPVGIDLGTSYSTVAYYKDGKVHFLEVRQQNSIPSVIFLKI